MPAPKFRAEYDVIDRIATLFQAEADAALKMLNALKQHTQALRGGDWVGPGATAFYAEMEGSVLPAVQRLAGAMAEGQRATFRIGRLFHTAEDDAARALSAQAGPAGGALGGAPAAALLAGGVLAAVGGDRAASEQSLVDRLRSVLDFESVSAVYHAWLRGEYQIGDARIAEYIKGKVGQLGKVADAELEALAREGVEARNAWRAAIRKRGEAIIEAMAKARRGAWDMPTYEMLLEKAITKGRAVDPNLAVIEGILKTNRGVDMVARGLKVLGIAGIVLDVGIGGYNVYTAPEGQRARVATQETGRVGGAIAGGVAGAKGGAIVGAAIGVWFGGAGAAPGAAIGGILGGIGGAIAGSEVGHTVGGWVSDLLDW
ncbi:MAG: WXG100 family type VII secretion target [Thermoflexales bacterium]